MKLNKSIKLLSLACVLATCGCASNGNLVVPICPEPPVIPEPPAEMMIPPRKDFQRRLLREFYDLV